MVVRLDTSYLRMETIVRTLMNVNLRVVVVSLVVATQLVHMNVIASKGTRYITKLAVKVTYDVMSSATIYRTRVKLKTGFQLSITNLSYEQTCELQSNSGVLVFLSMLVVIASIAIVAQSIAIVVIVKFPTLKQKYNQFINFMQTKESVDGPSPTYDDVIPKLPLRRERLYSTIAEIDLDPQLDSQVINIEPKYCNQLSLPNL